MLPPPPMLATKNRISRRNHFCCACGFHCRLFAAGPARAAQGQKTFGARRLCGGGRGIKDGGFAAGHERAGVELLRRGVAARGQPADAVLAYQRALTLDRDLVEAHYNLGCLWLEQNKPDEAKSEFTAYTLRRSNAPEGWLKLGAAQLRSDDVWRRKKVSAPRFI